MGAPRVCAGAMGAAQAGPTLHFLIPGNLSVGQLTLTVSVEVCVFERRAHAQRFFHVEVYGPVYWVVVCPYMFGYG